MFRLPLLCKIQFTNMEWLIVPSNKLIFTTQVKFLKCSPVFILLMGKNSNHNALFKFRDGSVKTVKLLGNLQLNRKKNKEIGYRGKCSSVLLCVF